LVVHTGSGAAVGDVPAECLHSSRGSRLDLRSSWSSVAKACREPQEHRISIGLLVRDGLRAARRRSRASTSAAGSRHAEHGPFADVDYHVLNRDLARVVCWRTGERAICRAWRSFGAEFMRRCPRLSTAAEPFHLGAFGVALPPGPAGRTRPPGG
jgi:hypothetical protein